MINILISVNENYIDKAETMLFSLKRHIKEEVTLYLLNHSLVSNITDNFKNYLSKKCNIKLEIVNVNNTEMDDLPICNSQFSVEMYYRILAQFVLPKEIDRILWLDADMIIMRDISEFYHQDFNNKSYVVCSDAMNHKEWVIARKIALGLPEDGIYFNSGVMLMNLAKLRKTTDRKQIVLQCVLIKDKLVYPDQDILNYIYQNEVKYDDWKKYNYQLACINKIPKEELKNIAILHYTGEDKPWNPYKIKSNSKYYWKIRKKQGHRLKAYKAYYIRFQDITKRYFKELKSIF